VPSSNEFPKRPVPAVGAIVFRDGEVLLVKRGTEPNKGRWSLPGGVLEVGETVEAGAVRETLEETGVTVRPERVFSVLDFIDFDGEQVHWHYVLIDLLCDYVRGEPVPATDAENARFIPLRELGDYDVVPAFLDMVRRALTPYQGRNTDSAVPQSPVSGIPKLPSPRGCHGLVESHFQEDACQEQRHQDCKKHGPKRDRGEESSCDKRNKSDPTDEESDPKHTQRERNAPPWSSKSQGVRRLGPLSSYHDISENHHRSDEEEDAGDEPQKGCCRRSGDRGEDRKACVACDRHGEESKEERSGSSFVVEWAEHAETLTPLTPQSRSGEQSPDFGLPPRDENNCRNGGWDEQHNLCRNRGPSPENLFEKIVCDR